MNLAPDVNSGSFFNQQARQSKRYQALETYSFSPPKFAGEHLIKLGGGISYAIFDGRNTNNPVNILRGDGTRSQTLDYRGDGLLTRDKTQILAYFRDKWTVNRRLTLDYGVRYDHDSIAGENGNDLIYGNEDNDTLVAGSRNDLVFGEDGNDNLYGVGGNDVLLGGSGNDHSFGGAGRDVLIGGLGIDHQYGQDGDDILMHDRRRRAGFAGKSFAGGSAGRQLGREHFDRHVAI